jgi:hypothetical protein
MTDVKLPLKYAKSIHYVLECHVSMGFAMVSQEIKEIVSEEAYEKLLAIFNKYHNANCGPFNRQLQKIITDAEEQIKEREKNE